MKWTHIIRIALVLVITLTTFSGAALTAQAAGPRPPQRYEERDAHWKQLQKERERERERDQRRWEKDHKSSSQRDADQANRKANIAIGVAAVAAVIALSK